MLKFNETSICIKNGHYQRLTMYYKEKSAKTYTLINAAYKHIMSDCPLVRDQKLVRMQSSRLSLWTQSASVQLAALVVY